MRLMHVKGLARGLQIAIVEQKVPIADRQWEVELLLKLVLEVDEAEEKQPYEGKEDVPG